MRLSPMAQIRFAGIRRHAYADFTLRCRELHTIQPVTLIVAISSPLPAAFATTPLYATLSAPLIDFRCYAMPYAYAMMLI